jgi:hypothetical protein
LLFTKLKPRGASFYAGHARWQLLGRTQDVTPLLAPDDDLVTGVKLPDLEANLAMSKPTVVIVWMGSPSEPWEP